MPELVLTSLMTLSPESLSATIDFSSLSFACSIKHNSSHLRHYVVMVREIYEEGSFGERKTPLSLSLTSLTR
ncbi:unnamed protein product [Spirodela intermedia]|uniref:Uncharacterized protein n=1 Tax=Spirodela intermedia TaxID=51605 RepID=A0A7I8IXX0_SPIIN|nr:unnamed protein product [Spirodela intermedia]CAA6662856.1 unnamed protein product [Spirodela intermedia]